MQMPDGTLVPLDNSLMQRITGKDPLAEKISGVVSVKDAARTSSIDQLHEGPNRKARRAMHATPRSKKHTTK